MELYKYCDKNGVNILQFKALKLSGIDEFNDPFEFRIAKCASPEISNAVNALYQYQKESYRVICFTKRYNNLIMWSHYSRNHTGLLIKFETDLIELNGKNITSALEEVHYDEEMISIPYNFLDLPRNEQEKIVKYNTYMKYADWKYEAEYRAIIKFDTSKGKRYIDLAPRAILEVVIGMNCSLETELKIIGLAKQEEFNHLKLKRATIHNFKYQMQYLDILPQEK
jgi:hypothetical protein